MDFSLTQQRESVCEEIERICARFGGSGLGLTEGVVMMQAISQPASGMSGASAAHLHRFGLEMIAQRRIASRSLRTSLLRGKIFA